MLGHHTKDKGDKGLGFVIASLLANGVQVALPLSEHLPFDCIAISQQGKLCRLSVKYRAKKENGSISVRFRSSWADKHGVHTRPQDKTLFDATAVFCPDTGVCYYVRNDEASQGAFVLRIDPSKNNQEGGVRQAEHFTDPQRLFLA